MRPSIKMATALVFPLAVGACTALPSGPRVTALPGTGKTFDQFRADDMNCRNYAAQGIGNAPDQQAAQTTATGAVAGTAIGALAGAAFGGGRGAGVGAGAGLLVGAVAGAGAGQSTAYSAQQRYDNYYVQCMYSSGERVPVSGNIGARAQIQPEPVDARIPPPPYGAPPPPPPEVIAPAPGAAG